MLDSGLAPSGFTLQWLIRMHVRRGDIDSALAVKADADSLDLRIEGIVGGMLLHSLSREEKLREALELLEDCASRNVRIPLAFAYLLSVRCHERGIEHSILPSDPNVWIERIKTNEPGIILTVP
jgi:hypothetical protein